MHSMGLTVEIVTMKKAEHTPLDFQYSRSHHLVAAVVLGPALKPLQTIGMPQTNHTCCKQQNGHHWIISKVH